MKITRLRKHSAEITPSINLYELDIVYNKLLICLENIELYKQVNDNNLLAFWIEQLDINIKLAEQLLGRNK